MFYTVDILFYLTYLVSIHSKSTTKIKHNTLYLKIFQIFTAAVLYFAVVHFNQKYLHCDKCNYGKSICTEASAKYPKCKRMIVNLFHVFNCVDHCGVPYT